MSIGIVIGFLLGAVATLLGCSIWWKRDLPSPAEASIREFDEPRSGLSGLAERYDLVTNNIAASLVIRRLSGETLFCSPFTEVLTGFPLEDFLVTGDYFEQICLEEDRERYVRARMICQLGEDSLVRYQVRHKSGMKLWLETRMVPVCDEQGETTTILSVTIDVTASVNYQRQIEEQNRDLGDFAYMVSHDLKAPIFTIKGMASTLKEDFGKVLGPDGLETLQYIIDGASRLESLVRSILEYSAVTGRHGEEADVELDGIVKNVLRDQSELIRIAHAEIKVLGALPTVRGEPVRVYQVLANLIDNALKYRSHSRAPEITIRSKRLNSDFFLIEVSDNGLGIPAAKREQIFRPYQRAHGNQVEGNGIGLACVKKIVEHYGGNVQLRSEENKGTTFSFTLPAARPEPQAVPPELDRYYQPLSSA